MFSQQFDYFRHMFMRRQKKNDTHIATCSHTKFHQASLNSFYLSRDPDGQMDGQTEGNRCKQR